MQLLLVRHGESTANAEGRLQGQRDYPLSELGRRQVGTLAEWLGRSQLQPEVVLCSPLARARETAEALAKAMNRPLELEPDLAEIHMGALQGLTRDEAGAAHPDYLLRPVEASGEFEPYGGESYLDVQARVLRVRARLEARFREASGTAFVVGHGGFNFQLLKQLIAEPVPRVCIVTMGNCSSTLVQMRERRGRYMGELLWHLPVELLGCVSGVGSGGLFR